MWTKQYADPERYFESRPKPEASLRNQRYVYGAFILALILALDPRPGRATDETPAASPLPPVIAIVDGAAWLEDINAVPDETLSEIRALTAQKFGGTFALSQDFDELLRFY